MKKITCTALACLFVYLSFAQDIAKGKLQLPHKTTEYYEMTTASPVKGLLILLTGAGEKPKNIYSQTRLPKLLAPKGFVTIVPETPIQMFADSNFIKQLDELIRLKSLQYHLTMADIVLGGLSDGGAIALSYAEYLNSKPEPKKLKAVFAIDPPADMARIYKSAKLDTSYQCDLIKREGKGLLGYLNGTLGASPDADPKPYYLHSAFTASAADGGNARYLINLPVRLYSEPDLAYVQKTYCASLQFININAYDLKLLSAYLQTAGNKQAEYITTTGRGFHSWNILDADDCVKWIEGL